MSCESDLRRKNKGTHRITMKEKSSILYDQPKENHIFIVFGFRFGKIYFVIIFVNAFSIKLYV